MIPDLSSRKLILALSKLKNKNNNLPFSGDRTLIEDLVNLVASKKMRFSTINFKKIASQIRLFLDEDKVFHISTKCDSIFVDLPEKNAYITQKELKYYKDANADSNIFRTILGIKHQPNNEVCSKNSNNSISNLLNCFEDQPKSYKQASPKLINNKLSYLLCKEHSNDFNKYGLGESEILVDKDLSMSLYPDLKDDFQFNNNNHNNNNYSRNNSFGQHEKLNFYNNNNKNDFENKKSTSNLMDKDPYLSVFNCIQHDSSENSLYMGHQENSLLGSNFIQEYNRYENEESNPSGNFLFL